MAPRVCMIGEEERTRIKRVLDYSLNPENWWLIGEGGRSDGIPGLKPDHLVNIPFGYRVVFTITKAPEGVYRHISISVPGGLLPQIEAAMMICQEFGFTDIREDLQIPPSIMFSVQKDPVHVVLVQIYEEGNKSQ